MKNLIVARLGFAVAVVCGLLFLGAPRAALGQNPVQWSGNAKHAVERAGEQVLPILVWVQEGRNGEDEGDNDLEDAQEDCFRDPVVVEIIRKHFVPLRASRNSRSMEEMKRLGLPTGHGLYCAVVTSDGTLLETMGPGEVAQPAVFARKLQAAYAKHCDAIYDGQVRAVLEDLKSPKSKARRAAQVVWRLGIKKADTAVIGLLSREDLAPSEKRRVYELLASLGTQASIGALLERADDRDAANALGKAEPGALEWLVAAMPTGEEGPVSAKQLAAYTAAARVSRTSPLGAAWWETAKQPERQKELERVQARAETVLGVWREREGR